MTRTLAAQRLPREPLLTAGDKMTCTHEGAEVVVTVTWAQPPLDGGQWVNGTVVGDSVAVWLTW